MTLNIK